MSLLFHGLLAAKIDFEGWQTIARQPGFEGWIFRSSGMPQIKQIADVREDTSGKELR